MDKDDQQNATFEDFVEEGRKNGRQSAGLLLQHCFGTAPSESMSPEVWWSIHEGKVVPDVLAKLEKSGASPDEIKVFKNSWDSELEWCNLTHVALGLMNVEPEIYGLNKTIDIHNTEKLELDANATPSACKSAGQRCGIADARAAAVRGLFRGYDFASTYLKEISKNRVVELYEAGLNSSQRSNFIDAATDAGMKYFSKVNMRST
jgi:hypothetical protein